MSSVFERVPLGARRPSLSCWLRSYVLVAQLGTTLNEAMLLRSFHSTRRSLVWRCSTDVKLCAEFQVFSFGWCPDVPDFRDFSWTPCGYFRDRQIDGQHCVDLLEDGLDIYEVDLRGVHATCATSLLLMIDWQFRKWRGTPRQGSH